MMWLKAFYHVEIENIFVENEQKLRRKFLFDTDSTVHDMSMEGVDSDIPTNIMIRLNRLRGQYKSNCPKN